MATISTLADGRNSSMAGFTMPCSSLMATFITAQYTVSVWCSPTWHGHAIKKTNRCLRWWATVNHAQGCSRVPHMPACTAMVLILFVPCWCIPGAIRTAQDGLWVELWRPGGYTFGRILAIYSVPGPWQKPVSVCGHLPEIVPFFLQPSRGLLGRAEYGLNQHSNF